MLKNTVSQRRNKEVQREIRDSHDLAVQFPLWFRGIVRKLYEDRNRILEEIIISIDKHE